MTSAPALAWSRHFQAQADPNNVPRVGPPDAITAPHERNVAMRTRAYRPEVSGCLEDRSLLSSVAGLSADPDVLTRREFNLIPEQIQEAFQSSFFRTAVFPVFATGFVKPSRTSPSQGSMVSQFRSMAS